jgi:hypothetical protein
VELVAALAPGRDEAGPFEDVQVLGDGLTGGAETVLHREAGAQLEQRLPVAIGQLVEDGAPRRVGERSVDIRHAGV